MSTSDFCWINISQVSDRILDEFDCGSYVFNDFLKEKARDWQENGEAVTYVVVTSNELESDSDSISRIYGYVAINAMGLLYNTSDDEHRYLPCVEIRMFAVAKQLRKKHDSTIPYSNIIFKMILQNLYEMSTKIIGFHAIFLNANQEGYQLYKENDFEEITQYIAPTDEEKLDITGTKPMLLLIDDEMLYNIFEY